MSERKVLNKYIPPNINPSRPDKKKQAGGRQKKVRLMAPFSMQCTTCGDYIYKGKKFNARKESAKGEDYLGIEISFKTDPKNTDYVAEIGAQRNFEPWREAGDVNEEMEAQRIKDEEENPLKALELRTMEAKREMDILDALDEIRTKNAMLERVSAATLLDRLHASKAVVVNAAEREMEEEDAELVHSIFHDSEGNLVKRVASQIDEIDPIEIQDAFLEPDPVSASKEHGVKRSAIEALKSVMPVKRVSADVFVYKKPLTKAPDIGALITRKKLVSLVGDYGSDSE